jgi:hypothetical protein
MQRRRRFEATSQPSSDAGTADKRQRRRAVIDETRRKAERTLLAAEAAEQLANAAQALLTAVETMQLDPAGAELSALRTAVARYRRLAG